MRKFRSVLVGVATAAAFLSYTHVASAAWLTPLAADAVKQHSAKVPGDFAGAADAQNVDALLVLVSVNRRDAGSEALATSTTLQHQWALATPVFIALITPGQLTELLASSRVTYVEPDRPVDLKLARSTIEAKARDAVWSFVPDARLGKLTSAYGDLTVDQATGKGVAVAIVDSGIDGTHPDFGGWDCVPEPYAPCESRVKQKMINNPFLNPEHDASDLPTTDYASGHGTHVAGIVAGNGYNRRQWGPDTTAIGGNGYPIGVAPQADLVSVKAGEARALVNAFQGIDWVAANAKALGIRVVNNSWGCIGGCAAQAENSAQNLAIKAAYNAGVLVTFAAGNDGVGGGAADDGDSFGGDSQSPYALSVANYDHLTRRLASSSSRGAKAAPMFDPATWTPEAELAATNRFGARRPDLAAPGTTIWAARNLTGGDASLVPRVNPADSTGGILSGGINMYAPMSGTSMASPHVAGAAAILFSTCPAARPLDVMRALMASANPSRVYATAEPSPDPDPATPTTAQVFERGYGALDLKAAHEWMRVTVPACGFEVPNEPPTAAISGPSSLTATDDGAFSGAGSSDPDGAIVSYAWDFGDGATATGSSVNHAFARSGAYVVTLTVTDDRGASAVAAKAVTVLNSSPTAAFTAPATLRHERAGTFDASGSIDRDGSLSAYAWDFGDGATGTGVSAEHAYTWAGDYLVRLTVTDDEGASTSTSRTVTVTDVPDDGFRRLSASGLTNHKCSASAWEFTLKPVASDEAPASVAVTWADGSRERVALSTLKNKLATYRTTRSLDQIATKGWADVPSASAAAFTLASGPCH